MARTKYIFLLIIKFVVIILTFFLTAFSTSLQTSLRNGLRMGDDNPGETIVVNTTGNTTLTYETNNAGEIIFDLKHAQAGTASVTFNLSNVNFDSTILREILNDYREEYSDLFNIYENGPWNCQIKCNLQSPHLFYFGNGGIVLSANGQTYAGNVTGRDNDYYVTSDIFTLTKGSNYSFTIYFNNHENSQVLDGKYYFRCDLLVTDLPGLNLQQFDMNTLKQLSITVNAFKYSIKHMEFKDMFTTYSLLGLLTIFSVLSMFLFLWRDLAVGWYTFRAVMTGNAETLFEGATLVQVYTNGVYTGEFMDWSGALHNFIFKFLIALVIAGIRVMLLMVTAPIRFFIEVVQNIKGIINEDDIVMGFSIIGNTIGPIGLLTFISSMGLIMVPNNYISALIVGSIGFILFVLSIVLCRITKKKYLEEYY